MERRKFSQTMAYEWQTAFVVSHKMPWCALLTAVKNYNKSSKTVRPFLRDQDQMFKTKTFIFVLEAPQDQDPGLEDYITRSSGDTDIKMVRQNRGVAGLVPRRVPKARVNGAEWVGLGRGKGYPRAD